MEVTVHYPTSKTTMAILQKKLAIVHAQSVLRYIQNLTCPKEQKLGMIDSIINSVKVEGLP